LIRAERLTKSFGGLRAVDEVSFDVNAGEIVGFLGPNGAGKTTTLRLLAGVFPPTSGRATIGGADVVTRPLEARRRLGYLPERVALYLDMPVASFLAYVATMKDVPRAGRPAAVDDVLEACGLAAVRDGRIGTLSKGYRQRVGLAQALVGAPPALLLDEPTAGLDPEQVAGVRSLVRALGRERAILFSTHLLAEVELVCDRVVILGRGRVLAEGEPTALTERFRRVSRVIADVDGPSDAAMRAIRALPGVRAVTVVGAPAAATVRLQIDTAPGSDLRRQLVQTILGAGCALVEIRSGSVSLEDVFLSLIGEEPIGEETLAGTGAPPP
jgi:ABC-2 type transport system ATP-binding protein